MKNKIMQSPSEKVWIDLESSDWIYAGGWKEGGVTW